MDQTLAMRIATIRNGWTLQKALRQLADAELDDDKPIRDAYEQAKQFVQAANSYFAAVKGWKQHSDTEVARLLGEKMTVMLSGHSTHVTGKAIRLVTDGKVQIVRSDNDVLEAYVHGDSGVTYQCGFDPAGHFCGCEAGEANRFCSHLLAATLQEAGIRLNILQPERTTQ